MKAILAALVFSAFCVSCSAQDSISLKKHLPVKLADQYCAVFKNGKLVLMGDSIIKSHVTLLNGDRVTINCGVIKKDGSMVTLKTGECIDKNGNIAGTGKTTGMMEK